MIFRFFWTDKIRRINAFSVIFSTSTHEIQLNFHSSFFFLSSHRIPRTSDYPLRMSGIEFSRLRIGFLGFHPVFPIVETTLTKNQPEENSIHINLHEYRVQSRVKTTVSKQASRQQRNLHFPPIKEK